MKKSLLSLVLFACFFLLSTSAQAQVYQNAIGARLGYPFSVSYKQFLDDSKAFEVYLGTRGFRGDYRWTNISGAFQWHKPFPNVENLQWYLGVGGSVYFWNFKSPILKDNASTTFAVQGYLGLDYAFADVPISLTLDWIPSYFINGFGSGFGADYGSLGVRYILGR